MKFINPILISNRRRIGLAFVLLFSCAASIIAVPFIVTTTVDNGNNGSPTPGSLRAGINAVNAAEPMMQSILIFPIQIRDTMQPIILGQFNRRLIYRIL